jgi:hypothetical protein
VLGRRLGEGEFPQNVSPLSPIADWQHFGLWENVTRVNAARMIFLFLLR